MKYMKKSSLAITAIQLYIEFIHACIHTYIRAETNINIHEYSIIKEAFMNINLVTNTRYVILWAMLA